MIFNLSFEVIAVLVVSCLVLSVIAGVMFKKLRFKKRTHTNTITDKWKEVESAVKDKSRWAEAIIMADDVLNLAVLKHGNANKKIGENLVDLQTKFSDNESLWFAHKFAQKLREAPDTAIKPEVAKKAILSFKKSLKDLEELK